MTTTELTTLVSGLWNKVKSYVTAAIADKQDTISDLATIRSGAAAGATAVQPAALAAKQDKRTLVTTGSALTTGTYVDFGTTDTVTPTLPATYERADEFLFTFTCSTDNCALTLPSGIDYGNGLDFDADKKADRRFQFSICDGIALYAYVANNS